jgi:DNA-binding transcriptional MerR regulator
LPIALQSDRIAKLEQTDAGRNVLNTLMIQTKLKGVNAETIKNVLESSQKQNQNGLEKFEEEAKKEQEACKSDAQVLRKSLQEAVAKRYSIEKNNQSTALLKERKTDYLKSLNAELDGYNAFIGDVKKGQDAWDNFYNSMMNSIKSAQQNLQKIREIVNQANPHNAASFAQVQSTESMVSEIKANLEYRFYDTIGMKPILTGLVEVVAKGITTDQFYKISHTMDLIDNFLADRRNNLIEDNEYESTLNNSLTNSMNSSVTSTKSEIQIVSGLISSLDTRIGLLGTAVQNAVKLAEYAKNVLEARAAICVDFSRTYMNHIRRYNSVKLTIAELSNTFDEEYKDFESFLQKKMMEQ